MHEEIEDLVSFTIAVEVHVSTELDTELLANLQHKIRAVLDVSAVDMLQYI